MALNRIWLGAILAAIFESSWAETAEICNAENKILTCGKDEAIMMTSAEYGHMSVGRCIPEEDQYIGCTNDVLSVVDRWCSGRRECNFEIPDDDLEKLNKNCLKFLRMYLEVTYNCLAVNMHCKTRTPTSVNGKNGYVSSYIADTKGCGSSESPWIISANPGQTIQLDLIDFAASSQTSNLVSCRNVYGFILERALGINQTICGGRHREGALYTSKTNSIEILLVRNDATRTNHFLIKYGVKGCSEIARPAHAWYKREGNEAVIGCEENNQEWRLTCSENTWIGDIGNCTQSVVISAPDAPSSSGMTFSSIVMMAGIIGVAVVLSVIAVVIGVVYVNKYRMHQETKRATLHTTYATMDRNVQAYYRPVTMDQSMISSAGWDMPLPPDPHDQMKSYPDQCTCATLQMRDQVSGTKTIGESLERQSLYSSIKST